MALCHLDLALSNLMVLLKVDKSNFEGFPLLNRREYYLLMNRNEARRIFFRVSRIWVTISFK
jgi:hypothetical protein